MTYDVAHVTTCSAGTTVVTFSFSISYSFGHLALLAAGLSPSVQLHHRNVYHRQLHVSGCHGWSRSVPFVTALTKVVQEVKEGNA